ncbi:hypothetical protein PPYR_00025 [Photinus pyralis]|uniref:Putative nuclease HARBI1 n=2 Tax=Photinus pyralis TaxID=7054 RepID=A0A1Y1JVX8_PHOPY|nr:putative nuclease HARBI1 [Photinus pyralis]XP_031328289.1 putative nuclease HARBI1 [Photinus pyralis]XP_031358439.1 putative nuclease HARBI1 [Photinus pyralis]XP_031359382.1 putative nuclease HARBI1 [Photinus pyralis]KAB0790811.1 hypothetical protein PPYR_15186 [Photinus pyralis]KAB0803055.1 hypothetical protein PPYR_00025 [Photinus pyralis]
MKMDTNVLKIVVINNLLEIIDDSSSSDEELFAITANTRYKRKEATPRIENYVENVVHLYGDSQFQSHFRMQRRTFEVILELIADKIRERTVKPGRPAIPAEKQLLITLWVLGTPDSYRSVCDRFGVGKATAIVCVRNVVRILYNYSHSFIMWPTTEKITASVAAFKNMSGFPGVIGAIDGTHISITAPKEHPEAYVNRKGIHSIQLQGVCDEKGMFIHCYAGYPGAVHDQRVFMKSEVAEYLKSAAKFPGDVHLLGDAAYMLHTHMMVPYKDNGHLTRAQKNYNYCHSSTRMVIERSFGLLKGRMRRLLDNLPMIRTDLIPQYIIACCVIHNICLLKNDQFQPLALHTSDKNNTQCGVNGNVDTNEKALAKQKRDAIAAALPTREDI